MAKSVTRQLLKLFGISGDVSTFGQFGSERANAPLNTKVIPTIQALSAWLTGWPDAINASKKAPYIEDMNSFCFVIAYQLFYLLQEGIPEWDPNTSYFVGATVRKPGTTEIYISSVDDNLNQALPNQVDSAAWLVFNPVLTSKLIGQMVTSQIADQAITTQKIADLNVTTGKIADLNVTNAKILSMVASKLTGVLGVANGGTSLANKMISCVTYAGNGSGSHSIAHGLGATPDLVLVVTLNSPNGWVMRTTGMNAGVSVISTSQLLGSAILSMDGTNVVVGSAQQVNQSGFSYFMISVKGQ